VTAILVALALSLGAVPAASRGGEAPEQPVPDVKGLPVIEVPAARPGTRLAVLLTGDGGWVGLDKGVAGAMSRAGVAVVGLDSLKYFWRKRTPDETARDVARIIGHYRSVWSRPDVLLVGYSRGADIVPFLPPRFPPEIRDSLRLVAMLGPEAYAEFEVHVIDLFASRRRSNATSTETAVRALQGERVLCVQGSDETRSVCPKIEGLPGVKRVVIQGGHHFDWDYPKLARMILDDAA
jgi:type IV secretory pathway VirJ component